ncbi:hypothetical protein M422DRAFT_247001 [Sphaerobolus stellatus SS14]|nr:hypothetical protein M422DRAFT_247001 [Sphaerobolus stellatus SS14]
MAPNPQCTALANALKNKGYSYSQVASKVGASESHITNIFTGVTTPTQQEFNSIANVLGITSPPPHNSAHTTK